MSEEKVGNVYMSVSTARVSKSSVVVVALAVSFGYSNYKASQKSVDHSPAS